MSSPRRTFLRVGHGAGKGTPHVEVGKVQDLPAGIPASARPVASRNEAGQFIASDGTKALAREGGRARAESVHLGRLMGLATFDPDHPWAPYARLARELRDEHMATLAATVGDGIVGPGAASIVSSAALQLAASRWLADRGAEAGDAKLLGQASTLANDSRQNLLAAHSLVALEAAARPKVSRIDELRAQWARPIPEGDK